MMKQNVENMVKKGTKLAVTTTLLTALAVQTAFAASISTVDVRLDLDLVAGESRPALSIGHTGEEDAEIMIPKNNKYEILEVEWIKEDVEEMELGDNYKIKITLGALDDYEFKSSYSSSKVTVRGGSFVSARCNDEDELVVTVKTKDVEGTLEEPDDARWLSENFKNDKFGQAKWDSVDDAAYDVYLYRGEKIIHKVNGLKKTSFDFYPYMTKAGDYTFKVRAVPRNDEMAEYAKKSDWNVSDELYVAKDEVSDGTGQGLEEKESSLTEAEQVGWIASGKKWFFRYPDGSYLRDSWGKINGIWYLFDANGEMLTGWHNRNGHYYYMNQDGAMLTGWLKDNDIWYYLNPDGSMKTGWLTEGGKTYYMDASGAMATGWKEVGGLFYYFYPDGHKAVNEVISGFYVDYNGVWHRP